MNQLTPFVCNPICGDEYKVGIEVCEDGNNLDTKGCTNTCDGVISGWNCTLDPFL